MQRDRHWAGMFLFPFKSSVALFFEKSPNLKWVSQTLSAKPMSIDHSLAHTVLYEIWFSVAQDIFHRVCEVTELTEEQREVLKATMLRPNDFHVVVTSSS